MHDDNKNGENLDVIAGTLLDSLFRGALLYHPPDDDGEGGGNAPNSHDRIVQTAYRLFSERGFEAASVSDISNEAGVNKALIYYYFEDKQALYKEVIDSALSKLLRIWDYDEVAVGTPPERLEAYLKAVGALMRNNTAIAPLIFTEILQKGEMQGYVLNNYFLPNALNLVELINEGSREGYFAPLDDPIPVIPSIMAGLFIVSRVHDMGIRSVLPFLDPDADYFGRYVDYVLKAISI